MKNLFKAGNILWMFGIIVLAAIIGFSFVGCGNGTTDGDDDDDSKPVDVLAAYTPSTTAASYMDANLTVESATQDGSTVNVKLTGAVTEPYTAAGKTAVEGMSVGANEEWLDATKKEAGFAVLILRGVLPEDDEYAYFRVTEKNDSLGIYNNADTSYAKVNNVYTKKSAAPEWEESAPASDETDEYIWSMLYADAATKTITYVVEYSDSGVEDSAPVKTKTVIVDWSEVDLSATADAE